MSAPSKVTDAVGGGEEAADHSQDGRLARAVRAEQGDHLALGHREVHAEQHRHLAVGGVDAFAAQERWRGAALAVETSG